MLAQPSEEYPDIIVVSGSLSNVPLISEASFKKYIEILSHYSNSAFNDMEWQVKVPEYHTEQRLSFNAFINISDKLTMLVKCWVISFFSLSYSLGTIKSKIAQISGFLSYVEDSKISFTGIRRSFVLTFLSQYVDSPLLYNSMVCTILDFLDFASQNKIRLSYIQHFKSSENMHLLIKATFQKNTQIFFLSHQSFLPDYLLLQILTPISKKFAKTTKY